MDKYFEEMIPPDELAIMKEEVRKIPVETQMKSSKDEELDDSLGPRHPSIDKTPAMMTIQRQKVTTPIVSICV